MLKLALIRLEKLAEVSRQILHSDLRDGIGDRDTALSLMNIQVNDCR